MKPRRVLFVHSSYRLEGGEDVQVSRAAAALRGHGAEVRMFAPSAPHCRSALIREAVGSRGFARSRRYAHELRTALADWPPDVVHVHNTFPWLTPAVIGVLAGSVPTIVSLHNFRSVCISGSLFRGGKPCHECFRSPLRGVQHGCYRRSVAASLVALRASNALTATLREGRERILVTAPSLHAATLLGGQLWDEGSSVEVLPNTLPEDAGECLRTEPATPQLVIVSRLSPEKGVDVVLDALARIPEKDRPGLTIVGDGPERRRLVAEAGCRGLEVRFTGQLGFKAIRSLIASATAVLVPSHAEETFGMTVAEAAAEGVPVVLSDAGALVDTAGGSACAWVVPRMEPAAWCDVMSRMLCAPEERQVKAALARTHVVRAFSAEAYAERFEELWSQACAKLAPIREQGGPSRAIAS